MKRLLSGFCLAILFISTSAWSAYSIEMEAKIKNAQPIKGTFVLGEGQSGSFVFEGMTIKLTPSKEKNSAVKINAEISKKTGADVEILSRPTLITRIDHPATLTQKETDGSDAFSLKVTPRKI